MGTILEAFRDLTNMALLFLLGYIGLVVLFQRETKRHIELLVKVIAAAGGLNGIFWSLKKLGENLRTGALDLFIGTANAADSWRTELAPIVPWITAGIFVIMAVAFITALGVSLTLKDTKENQARLKAADTVVKTFGGFFIGVSTTLLK